MPDVREVDATEVEAVTGLIVTDVEKVAVSVSPLLSVAVIVYVVVEEMAVGVPLIAPVVVLRDRPEGSAGETE